MGKHRQLKEIGDTSGVGGGSPFYIRWLRGTSVTRSHLSDDLKEVRE